MEGQKQDLDNFEDVVNFIADNTFMDGEALSSRFPGIADWLAANRAEAESFEEMFNLDQLRMMHSNSLRCLAECSNLLYVY